MFVECYIPPPSSTITISYIIASSSSTTIMYLYIVKLMYFVYEKMLILFRVVVCSENVADVKSCYGVVFTTDNVT